MVATLYPAENFNVEEDCETIKKAMKGVGTDEAALISVICKRSAAQRVEIFHMYKTFFGQDLIKQIEGETSGHFRDCLVALLQPTSHFLARVCMDAMEGKGTSEGALINVLIGSTNAQTEEIKDAYMFLFKRKLEDDVKSETSGFFKRILVSSLTGLREESNEVDYAKARDDAVELFKAGKDKMGTDESKFVQIMGSRSINHLKVVFDEYKTVAGEDIENSIKSEMSGDLEDAFLALVRFIKDPATYFADQLYKSMKGIGTNDDKLIRLVVWRSEIDMVEIKERFKTIAKGKTLESSIKGDCSGDYKHALLALC